MIDEIVNQIFKTRIELMKRTIFPHQLVTEIGAEGLSVLY